MRSSCIFIICLVALLPTACKRWVDVNDNPVPPSPAVAALFPAQLAEMHRGVQLDARYAGRYIQYWLAAAPNDAWDRHGYIAGSDDNGDTWRQTYQVLGPGLNYLIRESRNNGQWDFTGAAYALKAWMFQQCTDYHGDIIFTDAFRENTTAFRYDSQQVVYAGVRSLCDSALYYLGRTDYRPGAARLSVSDYVYGGNVQQWARFVYGLLARNAANLSGKPGYEPAKVIEYVNNALGAETDDFLLSFDATRNDNTSFFGPYNDRLGNLRQSSFMVKLLDGSTLAGSNAAPYRDPRLPHMLCASPDTSNGNGGYRGLAPGAGDSLAAIPDSARKKVPLPWGDSVFTNPGASQFTTGAGKYLFKDKAVMPLMTYAEMQFIKAEAALRSGDAATALDAYLRGIRAHFDFINRSALPRNGAPLFNGAPITDSAREAYMNGPSVKREPGTLTLSHIMLQKYIALWGWGFVATWNDLRRYHYTDVDPATGQQVYAGFTLPATFYPDNLGRPAYRVRPRYHPEYVWNRDELDRIGALSPDYHTYETWFSLP